MKIIFDSDLTEIGNAGLRCGHWSIKHKRKRDKKLLGWHQGKFYGYMWVLSLFKWVEIFDISIIKNPNKYLKEFYNGWIWIFPSLKWNMVFLMKPKFFEKCLVSPQKENTFELMNEIRKLCRKI